MDQVVKMEANQIAEENYMPVMWVLRLERCRVKSELNVKIRREVYVKDFQKAKLHVK